MDDFEAVATEYELENGSFNDIINHLRDRYKPNTNQTCHITNSIDFNNQQDSHLTLLLMQGKMKQKTVILNAKVIHSMFQRH